MNKINHILPYIPTNNITELNELIYAGAKLVREKIGIPSKSRKKHSKPGWHTRLETQIKKLRKQAWMIKKKERHWNKRGKKKELATLEKITVQLEEINQEVKAKEGRLEISTNGKTIQTKQDFPKRRKKILSTIGREWHENLPTTGCKRNRTILDKNMATKKNITKMLNG